MKDNRLKRIVQLVRKDSVAADIGTDHAYLICELVKSGRCIKGFASDINIGPLERAKENISANNLQSKIKTVLADGLKGIDPNEIDDIIIAGMGGILIWDIINGVEWSKDSRLHFVLQPMTKSSYLIDRLIHNNFEIKEEVNVIEGKFRYKILSVRYKEKKMITVDKVYSAIDSFAPFDLAVSFDNCGINVGDGNTQVKKVLIALDITHDIINEAADIGAELIITHHPVIFNPIKNLNSNEMSYHLVKKNIAHIAAHTNLDIADGGVNDILASIIGIEDISPFSDTPLGKIGNLPVEMTARQLAEYVKKALLPYAPNIKIKFVDGERVIRRVAICGGGGGGIFTNALEQNVDAYITGDTKYDMQLTAYSRNFTLIDAGHFATETIVLESLCNKLKSLLPEVEFILSCANRDILNWA